MRNSTRHECRSAGGDDVRLPIDNNLYFPVKDINRFVLEFVEMDGSTACSRALIFKETKGMSGLSPSEQATHKYAGKCVAGIR